LLSVYQPTIFFVFYVVRAMSKESRRSVLTITSYTYLYVILWLHITDIRVQLQDRSYGICGKQSGCGADPSLGTSSFPCELLFYHCSMLFCLQGLLHQGTQTLPTITTMKRSTVQNEPHFNKKFPQQNWWKGIL
jgi:hypothetical protein